MGLCPCCDKRLKASRRMRDGFDDLGEEYDLSDEEDDALIDEAVRRPAIPGGRRGAVRRTLSQWPRMLRLAEGAIRIGLNVFRTGRPVGIVQNAIYRAEQALRQTAAEIGRVTGGPRRSSALNAISNAVTRLQFARDQLQGRSVVPGGRSLTSPADSLRGALEWIGYARNATVCVWRRNVGWARAAARNPLNRQA